MTKTPFERGKLFLLLGSMFTAYSAAENLEQTPILGLGYFYLVNGYTNIPRI